MAQKNKIIICLYGIVFFLLFNGSNPAIAQFDVNDIINEVDTIQNPHKKASSFLFLAEYYMQDQPDSAIGFANRALDIAVEQQDSSCIGDAYKILGVSYAGKIHCEESETFFLTGLSFLTSSKDSAGYFADQGAAYTQCGKFSQAEKCQAIAKDIFIRIDDKNNLARLITNIGVMQSRNANYYKASQSYLEALHIFEEMEDAESIAVIYQNMGEVMALQKNYDKAVGYFNSAITGFEKQKRFPSMAGVYLNLGQIYIELEQWDVAKHYLNKSYVIDTTYKLIHFESIALKLLGVTYLKVNKLESAEKLIEAAYQIQQENEYFTLIGETSTVLAEVYFEQGKYNKSLNLLASAEKLAVQQSDDNLTARILYLKSLVLAKLRHYDDAYETLAQFSILNDSLFNLERSNAIMNLDLAYQTEKKEKQIDELRYNDLLQQEQLKRGKTQVYLLMVSLTLVILVGAILFFYRRRRRQNENKKREQQFLQGRFEAEEKSKDKIAQELHDDIGGRLIGIILQLQSSKTQNETELKLLQDVYNNVRRLSHRLDEPLFTDMSLQEKVRNYLSELKEFTPFACQFIDDIDISWKEIDQSQELQRNIYRIVQELTTNTIKFAEATEVEIQLMNEPQKLIMIYEDNGVGIKPVEGNSKLKFNTIRKRVEMFGGDLEVNSREGEGLFVMISIPLKTSHANS